MARAGGGLDGEAGVRGSVHAGPGAAAGLDPALVELLIREQADENEELDRLHAYYRNPSRRVGVVDSSGVSQAARRLAQECGLPARVTGRRRDSLGDDRTLGRREVVIENDIAWRVHVMIDFLFGKPPVLVSRADDEAERGAIESLVDSAWEASGGLELLQDAALLGHVFGHVDFVVRVDEPLLRSVARRAVRLRAVDRSSADRGDALAELAREAGAAFRIEAVDPRRSVPVLDPDDYRTLRGYVVHYERDGAGVERNGSRPGARSVARRGLFGRMQGGPAGPGGSLPRRRRVETYTEVFGPDGHEVWLGGERVASDGGGVLEGLVPVVHVQNQSQPLLYAGVGEVEPLIPLQDELNTRLSDRASRVTMQSFKMYLAKGIDGFADLPVSPGTVWATDNPDAAVEAFGGDASSPSEDRHIGEVRQALDKISGVPPVASGVVEARIGNLSSANALRVTMVGLIAKTNRKRVTYGRGICGVSTLVIEAATRVGLLGASGARCGVDIEWPDPLPIGEEDLAAAIRARRELGVPEERIAEVFGVVPTRDDGAGGGTGHETNEEVGDA